MTQNQLIQEYEFDPTLTTSELSAIERAKAVDACEKALRDSFYLGDREAYKAVANHFDGDFEAAKSALMEIATNGGRAEIDGVSFLVFINNENTNTYHDVRIDAIADRCIALVKRMPFDSASAERVIENIKACDTAEDLLWNFFFDFHCEPIASELKERFPELWDEMVAIEAENKKFFRY